ncbi:8807_t:CDS:2 [Ambispora gerdemannii]|uniref:8807_t:CDS:1 n=1 Tax=Ambispora gerdemannii TaxID=144530 RepID=A0A9N9BR82_9GLOM|nr:8807_t:CDS:2 [Ambispora gerdemannii]
MSHAQNAPGAVSGTIEADDSARHISQGSHAETIKKVVEGIGVAGEAVMPFIPLLAAVTLVIDEIVKTYEAAQYNKKICNALMDRVEAAQLAVKALQRRQKENEKKFRNQAYYESFNRFLQVLKKIKKFIQDVSQLQGYRKFTQANSVKDKFNGLITEFEQVGRDLNLAITIATEEQRRIDREALEEDIAGMKVFLANIEGGITNQNKQINMFLEEFSLLKAKVEKSESSKQEMRPTQIPSSEIEFPLRPPSNRECPTEKRMWRKLDVEIKPLKLSDDDKTRIETELALLGRLREGRNIIKFYGLSKLDGQDVKVMEWAEFGNLRSLYMKNDIEWPLKIRIAIDICRGLLFLHAVDILHHDIRCENILLTDHYEAKIANFHLSRVTEGPTVDIKGNIIEIVHWLAPEKFSNKPFKPYTTQCDIFSYGMLLWELGHAKKPYENMTIKEIKEHVEKGNREIINFGLYPSGIQVEYTRLIREAWAGDPYSRPTLQEMFLKLDKISETYHSGKSPGLYPRRDLGNSDVSPLETFSSPPSRHNSTPSIEVSSDGFPKFDFDEIEVPIKPLMPLDDGIKAYKVRDFATAWECFAGHAKIKNSRAIYWQGWYLWEGLDGPKKLEEAARLFKQAADDGIAEAQLRYALCILNSEGVRYNRDEFLKYLRFAADNGNPSAQYYLGDVLLNGKLGVEKDEYEGENYIRLAAIKEQPKALRVLEARGVKLYG